MSLRNVILYDKLQLELGGPFKFDLSSPSEAIRALSANFPKVFPELLREGHYTLVVGASLEDGESIGIEMLNFDFGACDIHILPAAEGAKNGKGIFTAILGVALIGAAFAFAPVAAAGAGGIGGAIGTDIGATAFLGISYGQIALFGASLVLSGISSLMTTQTDPTKIGPTTASYLLNGPTNNAEQGGAVPLIYGRFRTGSTVVSTTLKAKDISVGSQNFTTDVTDAKGTVHSPGIAPDLTLPGMTPPGVPDIQPLLQWQYPYPEWPGHGAIIAVQGSSDGSTTDTPAGGSEINNPPPAGDPPIFQDEPSDGGSG